ncbi:hypothetical protein ABZ714_30870 [Streptomyces sp. NPDC006798]|uniref:hypothetical protein n=1 Tax=Streptomyces sp. NPDC006798 TaxID=3155462 RepID=UPI0033C95BE7
MTGPVPDLDRACHVCRTTRGTVPVTAVPRSSGPERPLYGCPTHAPGIATATRDAGALAAAIGRTVAEMEAMTRG